MASVDRFMALMREVESDTLDLDPNDSGNYPSGQVGVGPLVGSKCGISAASYPTLDIANLSDDAIQAIYQRDYLDPIQFSALPDATGIMVADEAVNQGVAAAKITLQQAVGVTADGWIGPQTLAAAAAADDASLAAEIWARRALKYATTNRFSLYGLGWMRRIVKAFTSAVPAALPLSVKFSGKTPKSG
jgi:lysozyme family protein